MFHSILITGGNQNTRLQTAKDISSSSLTPNPDQLTLDGQTSITIKQVRQLETFLSRKPYQNPFKIILVLQAEKLTLPAQHALLKTLEEPPPNSLIFLLTANSKNLLETIISRCQLIQLTSTSKLDKKELTANQHLYTQITRSSPGQRIALAQTQSSTKDIALSTCLHQLIYLRSLQLENPKSYLTQTLKNLDFSIRKITANSNPRLTLESLFLTYPNQSNFAKMD